MNIEKRFYLFAVTQVNFVFKNKVAIAFKSSSWEVFIGILLVESLQNYAKQLVMESLF